MTNTTEEITLKDLFVKLKRWIAYLILKWRIIFLVAAVCGIAGIAYAYFAKPKYTAVLTFVLSTENKMGSFSTLAGQLGLDIGQGDKGGAFEGDNIIALLNSKKMIKRALFSVVPETKTTLINVLIDKTGFEEKWAEQERLKQLLPFPANEKDLKPVQDSLIGELRDFILKKYLVVDKVDKKLSFYKVSCTCPDELVSVYLTQFLVNESSKFYIETKTKTAKQNLDMLQNEADSLRRILGGAIVSTAAEADKTFNLNPAYQVQRSGAQQNQLKVTVIGTTYGEVVKNLELAKISLQRETPLYQLIDTPSLPLKREKVSYIFSFIGLFAAGVFVAVVFLTFNRLLR